MLMQREGQIDTFEPAAFPVSKPTELLNGLEHVWLSAMVDCTMQVFVTSLGC